MIGGFPTLDRIDRVTPEDAAALHSLAAEDGHVLLAPTHIVRRKGEIIGCMSIGGAPLIQSWMHSKRAHARDSLMTFHLVEQMLKNANPCHAIVPCAAASPFFSEMESLGYANLGTMNLFTKLLA